MRRAVWISSILITLVIALPTMAWASPPDPTWIRGVYDDADFDDVVAYVTSGCAAVPALSVVDVVPLFAFVPILPPLDERLALSLLLAFHAPRAPPLA